MKILINNDLPIIPLPAVGYIRQCQADECKCSWNLNLLNVRSSINKNWQHTAMNFESEKADSKFTKKVTQTPLCILWVAYLGEIHFTRPRVKCLRRISSSPRGTGVWCKFTQSLQLPHNAILYPVTFCYGGGQTGNPCLPRTKMPWLSDSSRTQKWNKSIAASLMEKTKPQHNMIMTTNPLKRWHYPQRGASLNECRLVWLTNRLLN